MHLIDPNTLQCKLHVSALKIYILPDATNIEMSIPIMILQFLPTLPTFCYVYYVSDVGYFKQFAINAILFLSKKYQKVGLHVGVFNI